MLKVCGQKINVVSIDGLIVLYSINDVNTFSILFASALWESVCVPRDQRKASLEIVNNMARHEPGES